MKKIFKSSTSAAPLVDAVEPPRDVKEYRKEQKRRMQRCLANLRMITNLSRDEFERLTGIPAQQLHDIENMACSMTSAPYLALRYLFASLSMTNLKMGYALRCALKVMLDESRSEGEVVGTVMAIAGLTHAGKDEEEVKAMLDEVLGENCADGLDLTLNDWLDFN